MKVAYLISNVEIIYGGVKDNAKNSINKCLGYAKSEMDDEPCETCKNCKFCISIDYK